MSQPEGAEANLERDAHAAAAARALPPPRAAAAVARAAATGDVPPSPLAMLASLPSTLKLFLACSFVPLSSLLDCQTTQAGLAAPKLPQPVY